MLNETQGLSNKNNTIKMIINNYINEINILVNTTRWNNFEFGKVLLLVYKNVTFDSLAKWLISKIQLFSLR